MIPYAQPTDLFEGRLQTCKLAADCGGAPLAAVATRWPGYAAPPTPRPAAAAAGKPIGAAQRRANARACKHLGDDAV